jgi:S-adenosylmethionine-dependent methyltransferase
MTPPVPPSVARRFRTVDARALDVVVRESLVQKLFADKPNDYVYTEAGKLDLHEHLQGRLERDRRLVIPWLCDARPLDGARVLEIGCGTGASTVPLAEQGAAVTGLDVDADAIAVARDRLQVYGLEAELIACNAADVAHRLGDEPFDLVIFYASLDHMTHAERMAAMRGTWEMLPAGGLWCVTKSHNRLWYEDTLASELPFYLWLPDELAFEYARFSPSKAFREPYEGKAFDDAMREHLIRRGRGLSYHEFELAFGAVAGLDVVSSLRGWMVRKRPLRRVARFLARDADYVRVLRQHAPDGTHSGFFDPYLDLILRKGAEDPATTP